MKTKNFDTLLDTTVLIVVGLTVFVCLFPFLHIMALSLSSNSAILGSKVFLLPVQFTLQSYEGVFRDKTMIDSLVFTVELTVIYTAISMLMTTFAAYALTKKKMRGRNLFLLLIIFTMYFSGGIIPDYLLMKNLKLTNTMWVLILPGMISSFNLIVLKTFFTSIPESLLESASLDGCSEFGILLRMVIPLSGPVLATLSLFYAVAKWNSFQDALFYINDSTLYPLQLKLYQIVYNSQAVDIAVQEGIGAATNALPESLNAACIIFATLPIIVIYPWLQGYFKKGVMIGAIKG
jgi:putative aldouronate transport system permease protein